MGFADATLPGESLAKPVAPEHRWLCRYSLVPLALPVQSSATGFASAVECHWLRQCQRAAGNAASGVVHRRGRCRRSKSPPRAVHAGMLSKLCQAARMPAAESGSPERSYPSPRQRLRAVTTPRHGTLGKAGPMAGAIAGRPPGPGRRRDFSKISQAARPSVAMVGAATKTRGAQTPLRRGKPNVAVSAKVFTRQSLPDRPNARRHG